MKTLSYHVYSSRDGGTWLAQDTISWTSVFDEAGKFTSKFAVALAAKYASDKIPGAAHYAFAWVTP